MVNEYSFPTDQQGISRYNYREYYRSLVKTGIKHGLYASAKSNGLYVYLSSGTAVVEGYCFENNSELTLDIAPNLSSTSRIDLLVLELYYLNNSTPTIVPKIVQGLNSSTPSAPSLTQTDTNVYQYPIAKIQVSSNAVTIHDHNITQINYPEDTSFQVEYSLTTSPTVTINQWTVHGYSDFENYSGGTSPKFLSNSNIRIEDFITPTKQSPKNYSNKACFMLNKKGYYQIITPIRVASGLGATSNACRISFSTPLFNENENISASDNGWWGNQMTASTPVFYLTEDNVGTYFYLEFYIAKQQTVRSMYRITYLGEKL